MHTTTSVSSGVGRLKTTVETEPDDDGPTDGRGRCVFGYAVTNGGIREPQ